MSALQLEAAATILGPLVDEVVFVGGATVHIWITEPGAPPARATDDVDVICEVATLAEYHRLGSRLRERGLREAMDEAVICRWRSAEPQLVLDVMPIDPGILGFSNPWAELRAAPYFDYVVEGATATYGSPGAERAHLVRDRIDALLA